MHAIELVMRYINHNLDNMGLEFGEVVTIYTIMKRLKYNHDGFSCEN